MARAGSFTASTWRSNQSFTAWLAPHTSGPATHTPSASAAHDARVGPADTTPQANAHIGGNQVTGFSSSASAAGAGHARGVASATGAPSICLVVVTRPTVMFG
jgi:hypothetical protein